MLHHAGHGALVVALADGLALVVFFLTATDAYYHLGQPPVVDKQAQGHDGESGLLAVALELAYLFALEQELALAPLGVVVVRAVKIRK